MSGGIFKVYWPLTTSLEPCPADVWGIDFKFHGQTNAERYEELLKAAVSYLNDLKSRSGGEANQTPQPVTKP
jgi:hypothetical protein